MNDRMLARTAAALLVATAVLFVVGVRAERSNHRETASTATVPAATALAPTGETGAAGEAGEGTAAGEAAESARTVSGASTETAETTEIVLGAHLESAGWVAAALAGSATLAALVAVAWRRRAVPAVVALASLGFAAVDLAEVAHQRRAGHGGLAAVAVVVALGHVIVAGLCARLLRRAPSAVATRLAEPAG